MLKKTLLTPIKPDYIIMFLRTIALTLVLGLTILILINWEKNQSFIAPLGILISALLASFSVVLSIDNTMKLKRHEISNQIRRAFFHLCRIKMRLIGLEQEKKREKISYLDFDRISESIIEINEMLSDINNIDTISIVHNDILSDLHFLNLELNTYSTSVKALRLNIIKPNNAQYNSKSILPNPLNSINYKIEYTIDLVSNILQYLKEGYEKEFPSRGGIEECAAYMPPEKRKSE